MMRGLSLFARTISSLQKPHVRGGYDLLVSTRDRDTSFSALTQFFLELQGGESAGAIDRWLVRRALWGMQPYVDWIESQQAPICIRVSGEALIDSRFIDLLEWTVVQIGFPPHLLIVRACTSFISSNLMRAAQMSKRVRDLGLGFALDDFGMQTSAFEALHAVAPTQIRLEPTLTRNLLVDARAFGIVKRLMKVLRGLPLKTLADYVDSAEAARKLRALGVDYAQGSVFGSAAPFYEMLEGFRDVAFVMAETPAWGRGRSLTLPH